MDHSTSPSRSSRMSPQRSARIVLPENQSPSKSIGVTAATLKRLKRSKSEDKLSPSPEQRQTLPKPQLWDASNSQTQTLGRRTKRPSKPVCPQMIPIRAHASSPVRSQPHVSAVQRYNHCPDSRYHEHRSCEESKEVTGKDVTHDESSTPPKEEHDDAPSISSQSLATRLLEVMRSHAEMGPTIANLDELISQLQGVDEIQLALAVKQLAECVNNTSSELRAIKSHLCAQRSIEEDLQQRIDWYEKQWMVEKTAREAAEKYITNQTQMAKNFISGYEDLRDDLTTRLRETKVGLLNVQDRCQKVEEYCKALESERLSFDKRDPQHTDDSSSDYLMQTVTGDDSSISKCFELLDLVKLEFKPLLYAGDYIPKESNQQAFMNLFGPQPMPCRTSKQARQSLNWYLDTVTDEFVHRMKAFIDYISKARSCGICESLTSAMSTVNDLKQALNDSCAIQFQGKDFEQTDSELPQYEKAVKDGLQGTSVECARSKPTPASDTPSLTASSPTSDSDRDISGLSDVDLNGERSSDSATKVDKAVTKTDHDDIKSEIRRYLHGGSASNDDDSDQYSSDSSTDDEEFAEVEGIARAFDLSDWRLR